MSSVVAVLIMWKLSETPFQIFWLVVHSVEYFLLVIVEHQLCPCHRAQSLTLHNQTTPKNTKQDRTHSPWKCTSEDMGSAGNQHFWIHRGLPTETCIPRGRSSIGHGMFLGDGMEGSKHQLWQIPFWLMARWAGSCDVWRKPQWALHAATTFPCYHPELAEDHAGQKMDKQTQTSRACHVQWPLQFPGAAQTHRPQLPRVAKKYIWSKAPNSWSVRAEVSPSRDFIQRLFPLLLCYTTSKKVSTSHYLLLERWTR